jgi:hypothetical protein
MTQLISRRSLRDSRRRHIGKLRLSMVGAYQTAFLVCVLTDWGTQLIFATVSLIRVFTDGTPRRDEDLMRTAEDWPPFIMSSLPFWLGAPLLLALAVETVWRPRKYGYPLEPVFVIIYLFFAGLAGVTFSLSFARTVDWPRDTLYPGIALLGAAAVVATVTVFRFGRHVVQKRRVKRDDPHEGDVPDTKTSRG